MTYRPQPQGGQHKPSIATDTRHGMTEQEWQEDLRRRVEDFEQARHEAQHDHGIPF